MFELQALAKSLKFSPGFGSKILDNCFLSWWRKMWNKNVQHTLKYWGLHYVHSLPSSSFHHSSSIRMSSCFSDVKTVHSFIIPVIHYAYLFFETSVYLHVPCVTAEWFIDHVLMDDCRGLF
jgi:hypothetical protein